MTFSREAVEQFLIRGVLRWVGILFFFIVTAFPFYYMVLLSFRSIQGVLIEPGSLVPDWTLVRSMKTYIDVLRPVSQGGQGFGTFIVNSVIVSITTTTLTLTVAILAAYGATRLEFRGKKAVNWGILLVYMLPAIVLAIPLFVLFSRLGLRQDVTRRLIGLVVVYLSATLPVALYMLRSYFQTIPVELEEAAMIDGSSRLQTIWRIVIPLAIPAIASTALYVFMIAWNEFLYALLFLLEQRDAWTLSLGVKQLDTQEVPKTMLMAGSVIITVPIVVLFFFFERFLTKGLTAGAVKG
ncbi:MAG: carbohydrate ABC transporter permease [Ardenticatenaceae bacterium]|nr:carbohydrate ABC transporter permease [Ardenticatenaceae bacterium]HBY98438.1 transporter [Chloroflexota bacterium]